VKLARDSRYFPWLVLASSLLICFGLWRWAEDFAAPVYTAHALSVKRPIGNNSDLYSWWLGARELLLNRRNPYSTEVTREIQTGYYGRPLDPAKPADPIDQVAFAYPLYAVFLLAPTVTLPFQLVRVMFQWLLLGAIAWSVPLWMYAIGFRPRRPLIVSGMVLAVSSFPAVQEFHMQNLTALVALLLAAAAASTTRGWLALSGFLLALSTIKPQLSGFLILWLLVWAIGLWKERKALVWSFIATMVILLAASEAVCPGWIGEFIRAAIAYQTYAADPSIMRALLPSFIASVLSAVLLGCFVTLCFRWRKAAAGSEDFGWALAWVSGVTLVLIPKLAAYNQLFMIPALLVLLARRETIWKTGLVPRAMVKAAFGCQLWQWVVATLLSICSLLVPVARLRSAAELPMYTSLASWPITLLAVVLVTFYLPGLRIPAARHE
jgi:Glycosyltransferase family 87